LQCDEETPQTAVFQKAAAVLTLHQGEAIENDPMSVPDEHQIVRVVVAARRISIVLKLSRLPRNRNAYRFSLNSSTNQHKARDDQ
jgi:hypothetical protein